jgi:hypothetical protein
MSYPIKIGRKPNIIIIKSSEAHHEMFTTNIERIKQFIAVSDYPDKIDPNVILKINEQAVRLSTQEFRYYFGSLDDNEQTMMYLYEYTVDVGSRRRIGRILKKLLDPNEPCSEKELIDLMHWEGGNHSYYLTMTAIERGEII